MSFAKRLLIANRGAIASRIARTARRLGWRTVGVVVEGDRSLPYVDQMDAVVSLGDGDAQATFLNIEKILAAAKDTGATAIHPGYGFLSESAEFAQAVEDAGLLFVGPTAKNIKALGNKRAAKVLAQKNEIPVVAGIELAADKASSQSPLPKDLQFPLLIKAQAGGGGRGMRIVTRSEDLAPAIASAQREAESHFGDGSLLLERYFQKSKHLEIQVAFDDQGKGFVFGERECSVQRRYQKLIEESPSPHLSTQGRQKLQDWALKICQDVGYRSVATVEFLWDYEEFLKSGKESFFFLEVNSRLQVEHAVTEERFSGLDLVEVQLRIAVGELFDGGSEEAETSPLKGMAALQPRGHVIECRLCAEDPEQNFRPESGFLGWFEPMDCGVRWELGVRSESDISPAFDSMIAKVIATADDRLGAIQKMQRALGSLRCLGPITNREFLIFALAQNEFAEGSQSVQSVESSFLPDFLLARRQNAIALRSLRIALAYLILAKVAEAAAKTPLPCDFRLSPAKRRVAIRLFGESEDAQCLVQSRSSDLWRFQIADSEDVELQLENFQQSQGRLQLTYWRQDQKERAWAMQDRLTGDWQVGSAMWESFSFGPGGQSQSSGPVLETLKSFHGKILKICKHPGDRVTKDDVVLVMESMKMETHVSADRSGIVRALHCREGEMYSGRQKPFDIESEASHET